MACRIVAEKKDYSWFEKNRKEQISCAIEIEKLTTVNSSRPIAVTAPVKSGKREIVIIQALRTQLPKGKGNVKHYMLTSLSRQDCKDQILELEAYGIKCFVLYHKRIINEAIHSIEKDLKEGKQVNIHYDESDFGTGSDQLMSQVWRKFASDHRVVNVGYSATNEEFLFSPHDPVKITFAPHSSYKGVDWFLDNNLVEDAGDFYFEDKLTAQGKKCIEELIADPEKYFGIIRFSSKSDFHFGNLRNILAKHYPNVILHKIDATNKFNYGRDGDWTHVKSEDHSWYKKKIILFICQTCTRSTEIGFHKYISFLHDYRPGDKIYSTMAQALFRVLHYSDAGHKIKVYGDVNTFKLAAGRISYKEYDDKENKRTVSRRVDVTQKKSNKKDYELLVFKEEELSHLNREQLKKLIINVCKIRGIFYPERNGVPVDVKVRNTNNTQENFYRSILNVAARSTSSELGIPIYHVNGFCDKIKDKIEIERQKRDSEEVARKYPGASYFVMIPLPKNSLDVPPFHKTSDRSMYTKNGSMMN